MTDIELAKIENNQDVKENIISSTHGCNASTTSSTKRKKKKSGFKTLLVSGVGFFADAYDLFVIDYVNAIIRATAFREPTPTERIFSMCAAPAGAAIGQLGFGIAADYIGRRTMFITTAALCICGNILSALVGFGYQDSDSAVSIFYQLGFVRFLLGIGIGGEYPLAATVTSEQSDDNEELHEPATGWLWFLEQKPNSVAAVFSMQGLGMLLSPLFVMLLIATGVSLENTWRLCLGIGAIPSAAAFLFRWRMTDSSSFKKAKGNLSLVDSDDASTAMFDTNIASSSSSMSNASVVNSSPITQNQTPNNSPKLPSEDVKSKVAAQKAKPIAKSASIQSSGGKEKSYCTRFLRHMRHTGSILKQFYWVLIGTSMTWFLIDVTFYGTASFKSEVVGEMLKTDEINLRRLDLEIEGLRRDLVFPDSPGQLQRSILRSILFSDTPKNADDNSFMSKTASVARALLGDLNATRKTIFRNALLGTVAGALGIPGYILSVIFIHKTGLHSLTLWGFWGVAAAFLVLGTENLLDFNVAVLKLFLFGITFFCTNFGPNATTFILPTTIYPSVVRATCHGFSAAMGKFGGVVGMTLFDVVKQRMGLTVLLFGCSAVAVLGALVTIFFIPTDRDARRAVDEYNIALAQRAAKAHQRHQVNSPGHVVSLN